LPTLFSAEFLNEPELVALYLPILRADLALLESRDHRTPDGPLLQCPITVYGGLEDSTTTKSDLAAWQRETRSACEIRLFSGNHFYLNRRWREVAADVAGRLTDCR